MESVTAVEKVYTETLYVNFISPKGSQTNIRKIFTQNTHTRTNTYP